MSNKSVLFDALNTYPATITDTAFPTLSVPADPEDVEDAILANSRCQIEIVKWLNTFHGNKLSELFGMVGMLSPAAQAVAAGVLQSDGTPLTSGTIEDVVKIIGDETSGGAFTGILESEYRREETGDDLDLMNTVTAIVPALAGYAGMLSPLVAIGVSLFGAKGRIAETVGYIVFQAIIDLIKQILISELYPPTGTSPIVERSLGRIADALKLEDSETEGDILEKLQLGTDKLQSIIEKFDVYLSEWSEEDQNYLGIAHYTKGLYDILMIMKDLETVFENNGQKIFIKTKVVDSGE